MTKLQKTIRELDLYKTYTPNTREDWQHIIAVAQQLLKEAGAI